MVWVIAIVNTGSIHTNTKKYSYMFWKDLIIGFNEGSGKGLVIYNALIK